MDDQQKSVSPKPARIFMIHMRHHLIIFMILLLACQGSATAGSGLSDSELNQLKKDCLNQRSGFACLKMAEETMCGRGFNEQTKKWMNRSCNVHQKRCHKGNKKGCEGYIRCLMGCIDNHTIESNTYSFGDTSVSGCYIYRKNNKTRIKSHRAKRRAMRLLKRKCNKEGEACRIIGDWVPQTRAYTWFKKSCALNDAEGCGKLSLLLAQMEKETRLKFCRLTHQNQSKSNQKYNELCSSVDPKTQPLTTE